MRALVQELKGDKYGHSKIGTIGLVFWTNIFYIVLMSIHRYCYGGKLCAMLSFEGLSDATALAHPSMLNKSDLNGLKTPTRFLLAEVDDQFTDDLLAYAKSATQKSGIPAEFTVYPGTCHGFAARGNLGIESVKNGFDGHVIESVAWFKKYLM
jgi:dienelactone hydrolase